MERADGRSAGVRRTLGRVACAAVLLVGGGLLAGCASRQDDARWHSYTVSERCYRIDGNPRSPLPPCWPHAHRP